MKQISKTELKLEDITVSFPGVKAVDHVSLVVKPGEFFSLLGPSGCGKTTLLRTIAGFYRQSQGSIYFNDACIDRIPAHKRDTGMVFQNYAVFPHLTVWGNVAYGLRPRRIKKQEAAEKVRAALELVDLAEYEARRPKQLSGGQQQRVAVARAIVIQPHILLMDEPLANLDAKLRVRLRTDLRELQQRLGITTIYVTHDQEEALSLSDRIAVMLNGQVLQVGAPEEVYEEPASRKVAEFVGEGNYIEGSVASVARGQATLKLSGGEHFEVDVASSEGIRQGSALVVSFRPHECKVVQKCDSTAKNILSGTVKHRVYLGSIVRYHINMGQSQTILAEHYTSEDVTADKGDEITLYVPPDKIKLFSQDGQRLGRS